VKEGSKGRGIGRGIGIGGVVALALGNRGTGPSIMVLAALVNLLPFAAFLAKFKPKLTVYGYPV
jgi:hypothetical protein